MKTEIINIRVDKKTKEKARRIFKKKGISLSTGIYMYLVELTR